MALVSLVPMYIFFSKNLRDDIELISGKRTRIRYRKKYKPHILKQLLFLDFIDKVNYYHYTLFVFGFGSYFIMIIISIFYYYIDSLEALRKVLLVFYMLYHISFILNVIRIRCKRMEKEKWIIKRKQKLKNKK